MLLICPILWAMEPVGQFIEVLFFSFRKKRKGPNTCSGQSHQLNLLWVLRIDEETTYERNQSFKISQTSKFD